MSNYDLAEKLYNIAARTALEGGNIYGAVVAIEIALDTVDKQGRDSANLNEVLTRISAKYNEDFHSWADARCIRSLNARCKTCGITWRDA